MTVEGAVVQNHRVAPLHALEDRTWPSHSAHGKSCSQRLAESADVRDDAVIFLASARRVAEAGDHFIENQQCTTLLREFAHALQISVSWKDATHIGHDRLGDHGSQFVPMLLQNAFERGLVIPRRKHYVVKG